MNRKEKSKIICGDLIKNFDWLKGQEAKLVFVVMDSLKKIDCDSMKQWCPMVNGYGELKGFICDCGYSSLSAYDFCPDCGAPMDNTDIEERIKKAVEKEL